MLDRMSDVSRIVDRLVKKNLVLRKPCKADKRLVDVVINKSGLSLLETMDKELSIDEAIQSLDKKQVEQLNELLDQLRSSPK